ncbi:MAG: hydrogenase maturation protease [Chromatiales bacterium]|nr:hydrogenase maturation protease [Chromatiales bacterium]
MSATDWLIIGIGNRLRRDDAVGPLLADRLAKQHLQVEEHSGEGMGLINAWQNHDHVILIDATQSGATPGTIHQIDAIEQTAPSELFHYSSHQFGLAEAIEMARILEQLPKKLYLFGIEGADFSYGEELSPQVQRALDQVESQVLAHIESN